MQNKVLVIANWENTSKWMVFYQAFEECGYSVKVLCFSVSDIDVCKKTGLKYIDLRSVEFVKTNNLTQPVVRWDYVYSKKRLGYIPDDVTLEKWAFKIKRVLKDVVPRFIFGEKTWPHEISIMAYARDVGIPYISPISTRMCDDYWFLSADMETPMHMDGCLTESEVSKGLGRLIGQAPPSYSVKQIDGLPLSERLKSYLIRFKSINSEKLTNARFSHYLKSGLERFANQRKEAQIKITMESKFCYFLHVQPEASIDVLGNGIRSNDLIFDWLSYGLGNGDIGQSSDCDLMCIKFHPSFRGRWGSINLEQQYLKKTNLSSREVLGKGIVPITISGTIAIEALFHGIRPIVLGQPFFKDCPGIIRADSYSSFVSALGYSNYSWKELDKVEYFFASLFRKCFNIKRPESIVSYVKRIKDFS